VNNKSLWLLTISGFYFVIFYRKIFSNQEVADWQITTFWYLIICVSIAFISKINKKNLSKIIPVLLLLTFFAAKQYLNAPRNFIISFLNTYLALTLLYLQKDYIKKTKLVSLYNNILFINIGYIIYEHLLFYGFFGNVSINDKYARGVSVSPWMLEFISIDPLRIENDTCEGTIYYPQSLSYEPQAVSTLCLLAFAGLLCLWKETSKLRYLILCIPCIALGALNITTTTFIVLSGSIAIYIFLRNIKNLRNNYIFSIFFISILALGYAFHEKIYLILGRISEYSDHSNPNSLYFDGFIRWANSGNVNLLFGSLQSDNLFGTELFPLNIISEFGLIIITIIIGMYLKSIITFQKLLVSGNNSIISFFWLSQLFFLLATSIHYGAIFYCSIWPLFVISLFECSRICSESYKSARKTFIANASK